jgi:hypothetical protein
LLICRITVFCCPPTTFLRISHYLTLFWLSLCLQGFTQGCTFSPKKACPPSSQNAVFTGFFLWHTSMVEVHKKIVWLLPVFLLAAVTLAEVTTTIPIVMAGGGDPVSTGLWLALPGLAGISRASRTSPWTQSRNGSNFLRRRSPRPPASPWSFRTRCSVFTRNK